MAKQDTGTAGNESRGVRLHDSGEQLPPKQAPNTETELLRRAHRIAGLSFSDLATSLDWQVPESFHRAKGWVGQLLEAALGADASTRSEPDFVQLGVELKSIPVDLKGRPRETTFVCSASLTQMREWTWHQSRVRKKLARVLWIPVQAEPDLAIASRRIGSPLLWSPSDAQEQALKTDWESFAERIAAGYVETITAKEGLVLQMRPKGANAAARRWGHDADGAIFQTQPKGFYLRTKFTQQILQQNYVL